MKGTTFLLNEPRTQASLADNITLLIVEESFLTCVPSCQWMSTTSIGWFPQVCSAGIIPFNILPFRALIALTFFEVCLNMLFSIDVATDSLLDIAWAIQLFGGIHVIKSSPCKLHGR